MSQLGALLREGVEHHRAGRFAEAIRRYDQILAHAPTHADTLHLRGFASHLAGQSRQGIGFIEKAIEQNPTNATYRAHLGILLRSVGESAAARRQFEESLRIDPRQAEALGAMGAICLNGDPMAAQAYLERAVAADPAFAAAWANLAQARNQLGDSEAARGAVERALALDASLVEARLIRALLWAEEGNSAAAEAEYRGILADRPGFAPAWINLANLLDAQGRDDESRELLQSAVEQIPDSAPLWGSLGNALRQAGDQEEAAAAYRKSLALDPSEPGIRANLGSTLRALGQMEPALEELERAYSADAACDRTAVSLANAHAENGDGERARELFGIVARRRPEDWLARLRVRRLCPLLYRSEEEIDAYRTSLDEALDELLAEPRSLNIEELATSGCEPSFNLPFHGRSDRALKEKYAALFEGLFPTPERRRNTGKPHVGMLLTDGNEVLFARSLGRLLARLPSADFRWTLCCSRAGRRRLESELGGDDVAYLEFPPQLPAALRILSEAKFDLLYFWELGTDSVNYFLPFARVAPVQMTSWGIQVTSGNRALDYYLSSRLLETEAAQGEYTERLLLGETLLSCQERRRVVGKFARGEFGLAAADHVYLCAQNPGKFHPRFVPALAEILRRDPAGRLVIVEPRFRPIREQLRAILASVLGDTIGQVRWISPLGREPYHRLVAASDVVLDPFPFGGVNTTYDAFSFHRPVVTWPGEFQRGRFTLGCYRRMGLESWVANSAEEYVARALAWGADREAHASAVESLAERSDLLFDDARAADELSGWFLRLLDELS